MSISISAEPTHDSTNVPKKKDRELLYGIAEEALNKEDWSLWTSYSNGEKYCSSIKWNPKKTIFGDCLCEDGRSLIFKEGIKPIVENDEFAIIKFEGRIVGILKKFENYGGGGRVNVFYHNDEVRRTM